MVRIRQLFLVLACVLAAASGCSDAGDSSAPPPVGFNEGPVLGCGTRSWTDPSDTDPNRPVARCAPGTPQAQPLAERTLVTISTGTVGAEYFAPIALASATGEFARENLQVEIVTLSSPEALPALARGDVDAIWGGPSADFVTHVADGADLRWVSGNFSVGAGSQTGLWVRTVDGQPLDLASLDSPIGSLVGNGSSIAYPIGEALDAAGSDLADVGFRQMGASDIVSGLESGELDAGWVVDPLWTRLVGNPDVAFVTGQPLGEPLGGMLFGPRLLRDRPEAGAAVVRALIRTINTHLAGDYKSDPDTVRQLVDVLGLTEATLTSTPSLVFDWEIRAETTASLQNAFVGTGSLDIAEPLTDDALTDRSIYEAVVGHAG